MEESSIGKRIREVRGNMTQAEFAERMGVAKITITRYEGDATVPDGNFLLRLEELFQTDPAWVLLGRKGDCHDAMRINPEEAILLSDYNAASKNSQNAIRAIASIIADLEKGKGV